MSRLQIRASTYRHREGFTLSGLGPDGKRVRIFVYTRLAAEHMKRKVKAGEVITLADFMYVGEVEA